MNPYESRVNKVRDALGEKALLLVTNPENVRYLTGYIGSFGAALISPEQTVLATDNRYAQAATNMCPSARIIITRDLHGDLIDIAIKQSAQGNQDSTEIYVEGDHLSASALRLLQTKYPHVTFDITQHVIEKIRIQKDESELDAIRHACEISTRALSLVVPQIVIGMTELQVALILERTMIDLGAEAVGFPSIIASGPHSAIPHHAPTNRELRHGDLLKIDFGASVDGYHADCTRTFSIGHAQQWQREIYSAVAEAQRLGRSALENNPVINQVDRAVRDSIAQSGFTENFTHGLGHGVGLNIHELPFFNANSTDRIEPNTVLTIEPGIYLEGRGGVRIEDTVIVGQHGYENLTDFTYELLELCI